MRYRDLLYAVFLSGDGNFHAQLKTHCKSLQSDPSLFGDAGVFAPQETYENYTRAVLQSASFNVSDQLFPIKTYAEL